MDRSELSVHDLLEFRGCLVTPDPPRLRFLFAEIPLDPGDRNGLVEGLDVPELALDAMELTYIVPSDHLRLLPLATHQRAREPAAILLR